MRLGTSAAGLMLLCAATAARAAAPSFALDTGVRGGTPSAGSVGPWLGPAFGVEAAQASFALEGRFGGSSPADAERAGRLRVSAMVRERGLVRPELFVAAASQREGTGVREGVRFHLAGAKAGAWIATAVEAAAPGGTRPSLHVPLLGFGAWARSHRLMLSGAVEQHVGLLRARHEAPPDTARGGVMTDLGKGLRFDPAQVLLSSAYASMRWDGDRFELESIGGVTVGALTTPRRWAQASLSWKLTPQLALVAAAGSRSPQYFALDPGGERQAALSVRFSQASAATAAPLSLVSRAEAVECRLRPLGEGLWRLAVRAPGARLVELQGDLTGWQPLTLRAAGGGAWEAELELPPGVHQLTLRVDGGPWLPPPGFPTAPDGFGGSVGVAVIE